MRWILDACSIIYLVKAGIFDNFMNISYYPVVTDSSVYKEVIIEGKIKNLSDAIEAEKFFNQYRIPVISLNASKELYRMKDIGEASCYLLGKEDGVCLTSDLRAYNKFKRENIEVMRLDSFYFEMYNKQKLTKFEFLDILRKLEIINAIKSKHILFYIQELQKIEKEDKK